MFANLSNNTPKNNNDSNLEINSDEFKKVVTSRRSVRMFTSTPIPENIMNECLDLALLAPNSSNLQPWEFYWVRTPEKKLQIVEACLSQPAAKTAAEIIVCVARTNTWKQNSQKMLEYYDKNGIKISSSAINYYKKIVPLTYTQGFLNIFGYIKKLFLFFYGLKKPIPRNPVSKSDMILWASKTCALAAENLMLALRAHSFDSCAMEGFDSSRVNRILALPKDAVIVMVIGAGQRAHNGVYGPRIRFERNLFIKEV
ncbi:nitroreductase family protein [Spirobacillus cienkowskii]|uniref:nitroreductase family protein n=1 Tax=Spirobacillus cienkowskii TaxID=495820 RepID=UPI0030D28372